MLQAPFFVYDSPVPQMEWPSMPNSKASRILSMLRYLESSQWFSPEQLKNHQYRQLNYLLEQASQFVPYYRERQFQRFFDPDKPDDLRRNWLRLPLLTRQMIQEQGEALYHTALPPEHGKPVPLSSSGSTGKPVTVLTDIVAQFFFQTLSIRHYLWHDFDFNQKIALIHDTHEVGTEPPFGAVHQGWGSALQGVIKTGSCSVLQLCDPRQQEQWLQDVNPDYLICYPTVLREILLLNKPKPPRLKLISTFGELVEPTLREALRIQWNISLVDVYSNTETGCIALQCPDYEHYHVQEEHVLLEVLDQDNQPCQPGQIGRVVITALHNMASPLIRYETGDYAQSGDPCPCGRGLMVLKQIFGRQRNMLTLPNGEKRWPTFTGNSDENLLTFFKNMQFQVIQKSLFEIDISLVTSKEKIVEEELIPKLHAIFGYPFKITFHYLNHIPRAANGKYEDFKSLL